MQCIMAEFGLLQDLSVFAHANGKEALEIRKSLKESLNL